MFWHNFKYTIKTLSKNRVLLFWTYAFPILLGTLFSLAFGNIIDDETLSTFKVAIINNNEYQENEIYKGVFDSLSDKTSEDYMLDIDYVDVDNEDSIFDNEDIVGYLKIENDKPKLVFKQTGTYQSIFKSIVSEIEQTTIMMNDLIPHEMYSGIYTSSEELIKSVLSKIQNQEVKTNNTSKNNLDYMTVEYFTLIGMACLYGAMISISAFNQCLANMSNKGKRVAVSPTSKSVIVASAFLASLLATAVGIGILMLYLVYVIKASFGDKIPLILLLSLAGICAGTSFGTMIASTFKTSEGNKIGITISFSMLGSVLSGMMGVGMKYLVDTKLPLVNKINPTNMITDGFYSLYYYDTLTRYSKDLIGLVVFSVVCLTIAFFSLRRQQYDNI